MNANAPPWFAALLLVAVLAAPAVATTLDRSDSTLLDTLTAPAEPATTPFSAKMLEGFRALKRGDGAAANAAFAAAHELDPKDWRAVVGLADAARFQGRQNDVGRWLRQALAMAPGDARVQRAWGRFQYSTGNYAGAVTTLKKAADVDPANADIRFDLGVLYLNGLHQPANAVEAFRQGITLEPDNAGAYFELGLALAAQGDVKEAATALTRAGDLAPTNPEPAVALARVYAQAGDTKEAFVATDRALAIKADYAPAFMARGDIELARGDRRAAMVDFEKAVKAAPDNAWANFKLGAAQQVNGQAAAAEKAYRAAIAADPRFAPAYNNLAMLLSTRNRRLDDALGFA